MTQIQFRSCCRYCVKGREREEDRHKANEGERQAPEIHLDQVFMGEEMEGKTFAFLVARERETRAVLCTVVPRTSAADWMCRRLLARLRHIGSESVSVMVKTDNDPPADKLDHLMEHAEGDQERIEDDHREQSSRQFEEKLNR